MHQNELKKALEKAESLYEQKQYNEALEIFKQIQATCNDPNIEISEDNEIPQGDYASMLFDMGDCYKILKQWEEATDYFETSALYYSEILEDLKAFRNEEK
jgi:tetratricopeptide (TPR) repeat protein